MSSGSKKEEVGCGTLRFQNAQKKCKLCVKIGNGYIMQTRMVFAIKSILGFFMIIGIAMALYGAWERKLLQALSPVLFRTGSGPSLRFHPELNGISVGYRRNLYPL